ncbi:hypothetical protein GCM10022392_29640 [Mucilaginibacter panaciglaebae]|uniref:DUF5658 domain-containing protein n=1 Tax=Mucilaginibacter panaciglaebae TaxID=502331 RepID=A0ABP7X203_9SPHI
MKILSIILTAFLFIDTVFSFDSYRVYMLHAHARLHKETLPLIEKILLTHAFTLLVFTGASLFLTIKKKYITNLVISGCFVIYMVITSMHV